MSVVRCKATKLQPRCWRRVVSYLVPINRYLLISFSCPSTSTSTSTSASHRVMNSYERLSHMIMIKDSFPLPPVWPTIKREKQCWQSNKIHKLIPGYQNGPPVQGLKVVKYSEQNNFPPPILPMSSRVPKVWWNRYEYFGETLLYIISTLLSPQKSLHQLNDHQWKMHHQVLLLFMEQKSPAAQQLCNHFDKTIHWTCLVNFTLLLSLWVSLSWCFTLYEMCFCHHCYGRLCIGYGFCCHNALHFALYEGRIGGLWAPQQDIAQLHDWGDGRAHLHHAQLVSSCQLWAYEFY